MPSSIYRSEEGFQALMDFYDRLLAQWPVTYQSRRVETRFGETHILVSGADNAPPLVLLHGAAASAATWLPNIGGLSQHFRVYALDALGDAGKSAGVHIPVTGRTIADWIVDVLDGLGIESTHVCGISLGGWMALQMARHEPQRVRRVVAMAPALLLPIQAGFLMRAAAAALVPKQPVVYEFVRYFLAPTTPVDSAFVDGFTAIFKHIRLNTSMSPTLTDDDLQGIKAAVLLIIGDHEVIYNPQKAIERAQRCLRDVRAEIIADAGHAVCAEQPERVNALVIEFLAPQP